LHRADDPEGPRQMSLSIRSTAPLRGALATLAPPPPGQGPFFLRKERQCHVKLN
jgi:hypothetical protein